MNNKTKRIMIHPIETQYLQRQTDKAKAELTQEKILALEDDLEIWKETGCCVDKRGVVDYIKTELRTKELETMLNSLKLELALNKSTKKINLTI